MPAETDDRQPLETPTNKTAGDEFVWPPKTSSRDLRDQDPSDSEPVPVWADPSIETLAAWIDRAKRRRTQVEIERRWLGLTGAPVLDALAASGWRPEWAARCCWRCGCSAGEWEADPERGAGASGSGSGLDSGSASGLGVGSSPVEAEGCPACRERRLAWARFVRVGSYEGELARAIRVCKYEAWSQPGRTLGRMLGVRLAAALAREGIEPGEAVIVPAPMDVRRRLSRGIDHAGTIAAATAREFGARCERWLRRAWRPTQTGASLAARRGNLSGAFGPARRGVRRALAARDRGVRVIVVLDDIRTTGATLTGACRVVKKLVSQVEAARVEAKRDESDRVEATTDGGSMRWRPEIWAAAVAVTPGEGRRAGWDTEGGSTGGLQPRAGRPGDRDSSDD
ncbi:MAG: hypothetical protein AAF138_00535 [Planctomycetota bacterium]